MGISYPYSFYQVSYHLHLGPLSPPLRVCVVQLCRVFNLDVDALRDTRLHEVAHASKDLVVDHETAIEKFSVTVAGECGYGKRGVRRKAKGIQERSLFGCIIALERKSC